MTIYTSRNDTFQASIHHYPVDGFQLELSHWDGEEFNTLFDKRMVMYTVYEAILEAFTQNGVDYWKAQEYAEQMGIEPAFFDDDEEDEGEA